MWRARHLELRRQQLCCPKSVGSQTTNGNSSRSQHGEPMYGFPDPDRRDWPNHSHQRSGLERTAHPESCQLASQQEILRWRKDYPYSVLKQHIGSLQAKSPERPNKHRTNFQKQQQSVISKTQWKKQQDWNPLPRIHRNPETPPEDFDIVTVTIFQKCNRKLKTG